MNWIICQFKEKKLANCKNIYDSIWIYIGKNYKRISHFTWQWEDDVEMISRKVFYKGGNGMMVTLNMYNIYKFYHA